MKVIIIGAGIAGLSLALRLQQLGIDYQLFEKHDALIGKQGSGLLLSLNGVRVLNVLDVRGDIDLSGNTLHGVRTYDAKGNDLKNVLNYDAIAEKGDAEFMYIARKDLYQILFDKLDANKVHFGKAFESFENLDDHVNVMFTDGTSISGDCLVGADGVNSQVRKQLHGNIEAQFCDVMCWRGISPPNTLDLDKHYTYEFRSDDTRFVCLPNCEGGHYWNAARLMPLQREKEKSKRKFNVQGYFSHFAKQVTDLIDSTEPDEILFDPIFFMPALDFWSKNRVTILGDSAHATSPVLGQGANQALEGAYVLAQELLEHNAVEALQNYEIKRKQRAEMLVQASSAITKTIFNVADDDERLKVNGEALDYSNFDMVKFMSGGPV